MRIVNKMLIGAVIVSVFGIGAVLASGVSGAVDATTPAVDISGPCDEAEHANDPQCVGARALENNDAVGGVDISGPCDEAEHANDPRCTDGIVNDDDTSGPGNAGDDGEDNDNSGPSDNSGRGNSDDDGDHDDGDHDDNDDGDDHDNSGPGNGDDDDRDSSGPGSGDDD